MYFLDDSPFLYYFQAKDICMNKIVPFVMMSKKRGGGEHVRISDQIFSRCFNVAQKKQIWLLAEEAGNSSGTLASSIHARMLCDRLVA